MPDDPDSVTGLLAAAAARAGDRPAIIYGQQVTGFRTLEAQAKRAAAGLAGHGIGRGDRVAFWLPNTPAYLALYFGCARLGAIAVAVNTRFRAAEVEDVLGRTRAKVLVMWPGFRGIDFQGLLETVDPQALSALELAVIYDEEGRAPRAVPAVPKVVRYEALLGHGTMEDDRSQPGTGCNTFTTSGTTRAPKFVLHSSSSIALHAADVRRDFRLDAPQTVMLQDLPLSGVFGFAGMMAALGAGCPTVLNASFDAERSVEQIRRHRVTHFDGSDEMVDRLLAASDGEEIFRRIDFAGFAAFNSYLGDIVQRAEQRGLYLVGLWGMSEMQALVARRDRAEPTSVRSLGGGRLVSPRAEARVRDTRTGELCADRVAGELEIRGPSMMTGYLDDPDATAQAMTEDGFVRTGDLAYMESDGAFRYLTRMGDVMRLGGYLVSPAEIEVEVQTHPSVFGVQVVSVPIDGADRAVAFVVPQAGERFDETAVRHHCAKRLARYKVPARIVPVDAFPVTESANGVKIQRARLRQMALDLPPRDPHSDEARNRTKRSD